MFDALPSGETSFDSLIHLTVRALTSFKAYKKPGRGVRRGVSYYARYTRGNISIYARGGCTIDRA